MTALVSDRLLNITNPLEKMRVGMDVAGLGLGEIDYLADTITLDVRAAELFDLPADVAMPRDDLHDRIHPDDKSAIAHQLQELLDPSLPHYIEVSHRVLHPSGRVVWVNARKEVSFDFPEDGSEPVPAMGIVALFDVTERRESEERVATLMQEMNHRLKNNIAVIQSIAQMLARSGEPETFVERFTARLNALAHNHDLLAHRSWASVSLDELILQQVGPMRDEKTAQLVLDGPKVPLTNRAVETMGLALHELGTNAAKHGAMSASGGEVRVTWDVRAGDEGDNLHLTWAESGGPEVMPRNHKGFGSSILNRLTGAQLGGTATLHDDPAGVRWVLVCPTSALMPDWEA